MGKTSMQHLIDKLMRMPESNIKHYLNTLGSDYLKQNKKEIVDAYVKCWAYNVPEGIECKKSAKEYYIETYGEV